MNLYASVSSETPGAAIFAARQVRPQLGDARLMRELAYVAGRWQPALSGATLEVADPATGDVIGRVPDMGALDARAAIEAAQAAFGPWKSLLPQERAAILRRWHDLIVASKDDLAVIMTLEQGKPLEESRGEIDYAASFVSGSPRRPSASTARCRRAICPAG